MANFTNNVHSRNARRKVRKSCAEVRTSIRGMLHGPNDLSSAEKFSLELIVDEMDKIRIEFTRFAAYTRVVTDHDMGEFTNGIQVTVNNVSFYLTGNFAILIGTPRSLSSIANGLYFMRWLFEMINRKIARVAACWVDYQHHRKKWVRNLANGH